MLCIIVGSSFESRKERIMKNRNQQFKMIIMLLGLVFSIKALAKQTPVELSANSSTGPIKLADGGFNGGGDTLVCRGDNKNQFSGYYNLDYLATYKSSNQNSDIVEVQSWEESKARIINNLERLKAFNLLGSFKHFANNIMKDEGYKSGITWAEAGHGIIDIKDEKLINMLPENCLNQDTRGTSHFIQTVFWKNFNGNIHYKYDGNVIKELENTSSLQISFLYVHEWLWTHIKDPEKIRQMNRIIHSTKMDTISLNEFNALLISFSPVFHPKLPDKGTFVSDDGNVIYYNTYPFGIPNTGSLPTSSVSFGFTSKEKNGSATTTSFICKYVENGSQVCKPEYTQNNWYPFSNAPEVSINEVVIEIINFYSFRVKFGVRFIEFNLDLIDNF